MAHSYEKKYQAVQMYVDGKSRSEIAVCTGVKGGSLDRALKEFNVNIRHIGNKRVLKPNEIEAMSLYESGEIIRNIEKKTGICDAKLYKLLETRGSGANREGKRLKYSIGCPDYFSHIVNDDNQGYFLGLAFSDGHVKMGRHGAPESFEITLTSDDDYILESFRRAIQHEKPLEHIKPKACFKNSRPTTRMVVTCKKICEDLLRLGVVTKNPFNRRCNNFLSWGEESIGGFLRGAFDGDGCVGFTRRGDKIRSQVVRWMGSQQFCTDIGKYWESRGLTARRPRLAYAKTQLFSIDYHAREDISFIYSTIYSGNDCQHLHRKRKKMEELIQHYGVQSLM